MPGLTVPRIITADAEEADAFFAEALARGHEGIMAKAVDAPYEAGRRGFSWLKVKPAHTLDLVILAAEWGHGRRHGWLSNLHLGARDPENGGFVMLGKTFKGLTDERLAWQTARSSRSWRWVPTAGPSTSAPSWSSRSPSATSRRARNTPAAWPSASPASSATARTRRRRRRIRSRRFARSSARREVRPPPARDAPSNPASHRFHNATRPVAPATRNSARGSHRKRSGAALLRFAARPSRIASRPSPMALHIFREMMPPSRIALRNSRGA